MERLQFENGEAAARLAIPRDREVDLPFGIGLQDETGLAPDVLQLRHRAAELLSRQRYLERHIRVGRIAGDEERPRAVVDEIRHGDLRRAFR